ncbi:MAG: hypothetical protein ACLR9P_06955, partial [Escherichia coli]
WCNSLTSSNLVSSANRVLSEISKPFFHAENGGFSTILAVFQRFSALHLHPFRPVFCGKIGGKISGAA